MPRRQDDEKDWDLSSYAGKPDTTGESDWADNKAESSPSLATLKSRYEAAGEFNSIDGNAPTDSNSFRRRLEFIRYVENRSGRPDRHGVQTKLPSEGKKKPKKTSS